MKNVRILFGAPAILPCALALAPAVAQSAPPAAGISPLLYAFAPQPAVSREVAGSYSRSNASAMPEAPTASTAGAAYSGPHLVEAVYRPFVSYTVSLRIGTGGIGGDIATPLARKFALRIGGEAFSYSTNFTTNGLSAVGNLKLGDTFAALDWHPFQGAFRISPGITFYNRNNVSGNLNVPGGSTFTLNNVDYTSDPTDPITGTGGATFGNKVAPRITLGWGNSFPRYGGHWSFPVELGFYYTSAPQVTIALAGSACTPDPTTGLPDCGSINTPANEANIQGQQVTLNNDLAPARFFPVLSFGVGYRFGH